MSFKFKPYSQTSIANMNRPTAAVAIDISSVDYDPGDEFTVYVDDISDGTAVKVDTVDGSTITLTKVAAASSLGANTPLVCTKVYKTGTTVTKLFAFRWMSQWHH